MKGEMGLCIIRQFTQTDMVVNELIEREKRDGKAFVRQIMIAQGNDSPIVSNVSIV